MEADFAIELDAEDETLEFPWTDPERQFQYYDLKRQPELLIQVEEARRAPELGASLTAINSPESRLESAKCDAWSSCEMGPQDEIFSAAMKFGSYVDLFFTEEQLRFSFPAHEQFAKRLDGLLRRAPEIPASAECLIRRCFYHVGSGVRNGFYFTLYVFGYGNDEESARKQWAAGLRVVTDVIQELNQTEI